MFRPFGTPSGPFGGAPASQPAAGSFSFGTPGFGSQAAGQTSTFGGSSSTGFGQVGGFGSVPRYTSTNDTENNTTISIQAITAMPAHQKQSLEELRLEDYMAGRKGSTAAPFGAVGSAAPTTGFGLAQSSTFGAPAPAAASTPFGTPSAAGLFGQSQPPAAGAPGGTFGSGGFFGSTQPAQNAVSSLGSFGQGNSLISSAAQPANASGIFGSNPAASGSLFPSTTQALQPPSNAFSAFGKPPVAANINQPATQFSSFSQPAISSSGGNLFGGNVQSAFGGAGTSGGSFSKPAGAFGGFGAAPSGGSSLGGSTGTSLFGQSSGTLAPPSGAFLFGAAVPNAPPPAQPASAFNFGSNTLAGQNSNTASSSLFSLPNSTSATNTAPNQPGQSFSFSLGAPAAPAMGSSFTQQPAANMGGFSFNTGAGSAALPPQTPSFFTPNQGATQTASLPLISASSLSIKPPIPEGLSTPRATSALSGAPSSSKTTGGLARSPNHFTPRASFRLQPPAEAPNNHSAGALTTPAGFVLPRRVSAKKLVVNPTDRAVCLTGGMHAAAAAGSLRVTESIVNVGLAEPPVVGEGDDPKFMVPSEATLRKLPYAQLSAVQNFTVGRRGVGQVRFLQPVDLTKIPLSEIFERIVIFEPRQITVYPEGEYSEEEKPAVGAGLNVSSEIRLEKCWPVSKANREPIKDMGDDRMQAHIERLKNIEGTKFIDYFPEMGTWVFRVEHFSTYGLADEYSTDPAPDGIPQREEHSKKSQEWEALVFQNARDSLQGTARRFSACWLLDGSAVITRSGVSCVQTVPCPKAAPEDGVIKAMSSSSEFFESGDPALSLLLELPGILSAKGADQIRLICSWLLKRSSPHRSKDPALAAVLAGDLHSLVSILQSSGCPRLATVASVLGGRGDLQDLALMQLSHQSQLPSLDLMIWSLLAGRVDCLLQDGSISWENLLFVILSYIDSTLISAVETLESIMPPPPKDFAWALLRHHCALNKPFGSYPLMHDLRPDRVGSRHDWSRLWMLCRSIFAGRPEQPLLKAHLASQLLANGYWHLAATLTNPNPSPGLALDSGFGLDLSQFLRTEAELELLTLAQRSFYRKQVEFVRGKFGHAKVSVALASRYGYYGNVSRQTDLLLRGGAYMEAQAVSQPVLVEAIITGDDEVIEKYVQKIPTTARHTMCLILCDYLRIKVGLPAEDRDALVQRVSTLTAGNLRERVAFAELAARICQSYPSPALLPLLPDDQRRALLYKVSN